MKRKIYIIRKLCPGSVSVGLFTVFILCFVSKLLTAQNAADYIIRANQVFTEQSIYSLQMTVSYYSKQNSPSAESTDTLHMSKKNNMLWYQYQDNTILMNDSYSIQVSDQLKCISIARLSKKTKDINKPVIIPELDSSKCHIVLKTDELIRIEYRPDGLFPGVERIVIESEAATGNLKCLDYYYTPAEGILLERILYKVDQFNSAALFDDSVFSEKRLISEKNGVFSGVGYRKDYRVVMLQ